MADPRPGGAGDGTIIVQWALRVMIKIKFNDDKATLLLFFMIARLSSLFYVWAGLGPPSPRGGLRFMRRRQRVPCVHAEASAGPLVKQTAVRPAHQAGARTHCELPHLIRVWFAVPKVYDASVVL